MLPPWLSRRRTTGTHLATIWACQAGKHVYVEKPASHNMSRVGAWSKRPAGMIASSSWERNAAALPHFASAAELVRSGKLGKVPFVRTWIAGNRQVNRP